MKFTLVPKVWEPAESPAVLCRTTSVSSVDMRLLLLLYTIGMTSAALHKQSPPNTRLHNLVNFEQAMDNHLKSTTTEQVNFLQRASSLLGRLASEQSRGGIKEDYSNNPLPALVLVRRLVEDWVSLVCQVWGNLGVGLSRLGLGGTRWPSPQQLDAAALTVMRAQWTYNLDIDSLASGVVNGSHIILNVTAADCFHLVHMYLKNGFEDEASEWLEQALHKINQGDNSVQSQTLKHYFAVLKCYSGDTASSQKTLADLAKNNRYLKVDLQDSLQIDYKHILLLGCNELHDELDKERQLEWYQGIPKSNLTKHRELCSSKEHLSVANNLRCRYVHHQQPHLRIQPFKLEELQLEPPVLRFYDVVTDGEVEMFKSFGSKWMEAAGTVTETGGFAYNTYRTSQHAWIYYRMLEVNDRLELRMEDMTQLTALTAEPSQLGRYSISGEYLPHHDYLQLVGKPFLHDRIATLMFILGDVEEGGNTVFLDWNLTVAPAKNSALLWFNYLPNGELDESSLHSGCPVLRGTKWVINKWFHNWGNEFKKPCGLHQNDTFLTHYLH